jgi:hypothetical protein
MIIGKHISAQHSTARHSTAPCYQHSVEPVGHIIKQRAAEQHQQHKAELKEKES